MRLTATTVALQDGRDLLDLPPTTADVQLWVRQGEGLVGWGVAARLHAHGSGRFTGAAGALHTLAAEADVDDRVHLPGTGLVALGSFAFADGGGPSCLVVPRVVVGRRDGASWLTRIDPPGAAPAPGPAARPLAGGRHDRPRFAGSSNPDLHWLEAVSRAVRRIEAGELEKVVLARDYAVWTHEPFDELELARRLAARFPSCHTFVVEGLVGATPELLVARRGSRVTSRVLAGTAARGRHAADDEALGAALRASHKEELEHRLAVASVRGVLDTVCRELRADPEPTLLRLDNVQHLATTLEGTLVEPCGSLELAGRLHPTAAVGGTPRDAAVALIRELEGMERGRYAAPVGWTTPDGDGEWGIALRCAELAGARARLFAGAGIVAGSLPEDELEETRLKLLAMQAALDATPTGP